MGDAQEEEQDWGSWLNFSVPRTAKFYELANSEAQHESVDSQCDTQVVPESPAKEVDERGATRVHAKSWAMTPHTWSRQGTQYFSPSQEAALARNEEDACMELLTQREWMDFVEDSDPERQSK